MGFARHRYLVILALVQYLDWRIYLDAQAMVGE